MNKKNTLSILQAGLEDIRKMPATSEKSQDVASPTSDGKPANSSDQASVGHGTANTSSKKSQTKVPSKKIGNKNALCHGHYSNELMLPWESPEDFEKLHDSFKAEWKPSGATEENAVIELTNYTWILWRAAKGALVHYHQVPFGGKELRSGTMNWQDIMQHQEETPEVAETSLALINENLSRLNTLLETVRNEPTQIDTAEGKKRQMETTTLVSKAADTITIVKQLVPIIEDLAILTVKHWARFAKAYQPDEIEKQVRVMAMIDARIDKVLRRLVSLKEYKRCAAAQDSSMPKVKGPAVAPT